MDASHLILPQMLQPIFIAADVFHLEDTGFFFFPENNIPIGRKEMRGKKSLAFIAAK